MVDLYWHSKHDNFNLAVLPLLCIVNIYFLFVDRGIYWVQYITFMLYMLLDTLWLLIIPDCVASPSTILAHHVVAITAFSAPLFDNYRYADLISYGILVEINTWLLIARRNFKEHFLINFMFYVTWVGFRLVMYPAVLFHYIGLYWENSTQEGSFTNVGMGLLVLMISINALNMKWSYDLAYKLIRAWRHRSPVFSSGTQSFKNSSSAHNNEECEQIEEGSGLMDGKDRGL